MNSIKKVAVLNMVISLSVLFFYSPVTANELLSKKFAEANEKLKNGDEAGAKKILTELKAQFESTLAKLPQILKDKKKLELGQGMYRDIIDAIDSHIKSSDIKNKVAKKTQKMAKYSKSK